MAANEYHKRLQDLESISLPIEKSWAKNVYWVTQYCSMMNMVWMLIN